MSTIVQLPSIELVCWAEQQVALNLLLHYNSGLEFATWPDMNTNVCQMCESVIGSWSYQFEWWYVNVFAACFFCINKISYCRLNQCDSSASWPFTSDPRVWPRPRALHFSWSDAASTQRWMFQNWWVPSFWNPLLTDTHRRRRRERQQRLFR